MVEVLSGLPVVAKYRAVEIRATGIKVLFRGAWKFIGHATCRSWFTSRDEMLDFLKRVVQRQLSLHLNEAKKAAQYLADLPEVEMGIVPPAERAVLDKRMEF